MINLPGNEAGFVCQRHLHSEVYLIRDWCAMHLESINSRPTHSWRSCMRRVTVRVWAVCVSDEGSHRMSFRV
jgi:hypothetical protein